ncbi:hypothetical protein HYH03_001353 [Edaphochlamys debaryana]|uniref:Ankyrin repeat domain-containing protein n=1 Tax=Edaphochlamys debaryana TaxID=47281 RepID=A0A835YL67_9CHLO|nr:hypothetical protein HYH03_001353 [Edaphochlamys debaryana]|eukprot:KAG2500585.1 hypothetical protein HYH03_001353 [Edaphochlamys debaryana]
MTVIVMGANHALLDALLQQAALLPAPAPAGALEQLARAAEQAVALMAQQQAQDQRLMAQQQEQLERLQAQVAELQAQQERAVTAEQLADRDARIEALEAQLREAPARAPWLRSMAVGEALCEAVESGDAAQVNALLASGADVSYARQEDDMTPLLLAARDGRTALVEALLAPGAELEAAHPNDARPLHMAAHEGHAGVIRALLEAGAQKDAVRRVYMAGAMQPLHLAIRRNHLMAAKALLEAGADVEAVSGWFDWSPLHFAAGWNGGNAAMIRALHEAGADLESRATDDRIMHGVRLCTPLILAALYGFMEPVEALLAAGADTAARGEARTCCLDGKTALEQARAKGHTEVAELLQRRG